MRISLVEKCCKLDYNVLMISGKISIYCLKARMHYNKIQYIFTNTFTKMSTLPFTIIIPGMAPLTNFQCDNNIYHVDVCNPTSIHSACLTLTTPLPDNIALGFYYSLPPYTNLQYLGAIWNNRPSDIFSTGFPLRPEIAESSTVKLCIKPQTFVELKELVVATDGKKQYTKLVAQNLYNYMMSYNKSGLLVNGVQGEYLVIPSNFLDKWLQKFEAKYAKDPNFMLKTTYN